MGQESWDNRKEAVQNETLKAYSTAQGETQKVVMV